MPSLAIITARGGSKRIPQKNIRDFCGKPIIAYSIEAAIKSECFDEIMVSTDSEEIAQIAKKYGANVPFLRSSETSNDFAATADVVNEVLSQYKEHGKSFDIFCCLYPTAPFVTAEKIKSAFAILKQSKASSAVSVVRFDFPPQRALIMQNDKLVYQYPQFAPIRSQDLQPIYHDCGQLYLCDTKIFEQCNSLFTNNTVPIIMPEEETQDIDNFSDWVLAEIKYKQFILKATQA